MSHFQVFLGPEGISTVEFQCNCCFTMIRSMTWLPSVPKMCRHSLSVTCCQHFLLPKKSVPRFTPSPHFAPCYPTGVIHVQCDGYTHNLRSLQSPFVNVDRHITLQTEFLGAFIYQFPATVIHY
jgi:hypothetical protein